MKSILISIKPEWVAKILNGEKTIEIRKTMPKCELPIDVYIYCSKGNKKDWHLLEVVDTDTGWEGYEYDYYIGSKGYLRWCLEGKVLAKFTLREVEKIKFHFGYYDMGEWTESYILENACLTSNELDNYFKASKDYDEKKIAKVCGYAWHIEDLVIFKKPKKLSEFKRPNPSKNKHLDRYVPVKIPQSYCYVEKFEGKK